MTNFTPEYCEQQYNARAAVPEHPQIIARWVSESATVRANQRCELDLEYGPMPAANHFTIVGELAKPESPLHQAALTLMGV